MTDELDYIEMCRKSPVQKDWKQKVRDRYYFHSYRSGDDIIERNEVYFFFDGDEIYDNWSVTWLPYQEDWQEMLNSQGKHIPSQPQILAEWINASGLHGKITSTAESTSHYWTVLWCMYYHQKVLGLIWDFKKKEWKHRR